MSYLEPLRVVRKYIETKPLDMKAYEDYFSALIGYKGEDKADAYKLNWWLRSELAKIVANGTDVGIVGRAFELSRKTYLLSAQDNFDDYMIYVEWNRERQKKFWLPRRKVLLPVVKEIQRLVDDELDLLAISLPPGVGKSSCKIFLLSWLIGRDPDRPCLDSGHSGMMTQSTYDGVLSILSDKQEYLWADVFPMAGSLITNAKELTIDIGKKHRFSSLTCRAIGASLTGATRCEQLLSADDLVSGIEEALSRDRLDKKWEAYNNDLKSRKKLGCKELHISTRWSVHDVIGRLERQYTGDPRAKFIVVPALNEDGESNFNYDYGVGFDTTFFVDMKNSLDDASFLSLYQNEPIERTGLLYHEDELRRYFELPADEPDAVIAILDSKDKGKDYAFLPVAYKYGEDCYIDDCVCNQGIITDEIAVVILLKHKVKACRVESNSAGGKIAEKIQKEIKSRNGITHITTRFSTSNKETRILVNAEWVKDHCLFKHKSMYSGGSEYGTMMRLLTTYSLMGKNKYDDVPDGMSMLAEFIQSLEGNAVQVFKRPF